MENQLRSRFIFSKPKQNTKLFPDPHPTAGKTAIELTLSIEPSATEANLSRVIARHNDDVVGRLSFRTSRPTIKILFVSIAENYQGAGIANLLYEYLEKHTKGFLSIHTTPVAYTNKKSLRLHKSSGFHAAHPLHVKHALTGKPPKEKNTHSTFHKIISKRTVLHTFAEASPEKRTVYLRSNKPRQNQSPQELNNVF